MSSEIILPDENAGEENKNEKKTNKRSRKGRVIIVSGIALFVLVGFGLFVFSGEETRTKSASFQSSTLNNAGTGQFNDSKIQEALKEKIDEKNLEELKNQVRAGESVVHFKDVPVEKVVPVVADVPTPKKGIPEPPIEETKSMFAEIDRFSQEQKERIAKASQSAQGSTDVRSNRIIGSKVPSSSRPTPSQIVSGRSLDSKKPSNQNQNYDEQLNNSHQTPVIVISEEEQREQQREQQRNLGFIKLAQSMRSQSSENITRPSSVYHSNQHAVSFNLNAAGNSSIGAGVEPSAISNEEESRVLTMQHAGDLGIGWLEGLVDSDVPSAMVVAEILEGPLRGGRILGNHSFEGECILIDFSRLQWRGREVAIRAAAADNKTGQTCLSGKVNYRLMQRYGVPILFSVARVGQVYNAQKDSDTTTISGLGTSTTQGGRSFKDVATDTGIDSSMEALQNPVNRLANMPIQIKKDQGIIGIRWFERVEIDMAVER